MKSRSSTKTSRAQVRREWRTGAKVGVLTSVQLTQMELHRASVWLPWQRPHCQHILEATSAAETCIDWTSKPEGSWRRSPDCPRTVQRTRSSHTAEDEFATSQDNTNRAVGHAVAADALEVNEARLVERATHTLAARQHGRVKHPDVVRVVPIQQQQQQFNYACDAKWQGAARIVTSSRCCKRSGWTSCTRCKRLDWVARCRSSAGTSGGDTHDHD
jgi:hypothetical protein